MPLDRERGEKSPLGHQHRVVPVAKYKELENIRVPYEVMSGSQFKVPVTVSRPMYVDAVARAREAFEERGAIFANTRLALSFPEDAILVQEYPAEGAVEFIFCRKVADMEMYVRIPPYTLPPNVLGWLKATHRWSET